MYCPTVHSDLLNVSETWSLPAEDARCLGIFSVVALGTNGITVQSNKDEFYQPFNDLLHSLSESDKAGHKQVRWILILAACEQSSALSNSRKEKRP